MRARLISSLITMVACAGAWVASSAAAQPSLPHERPISPATPVTAIGTVPRTNGQSAPLPLVPDFGLGDLESYDATISTVFPFSLDTYPKDSLVDARRARSADWLAHVHATSVTDRVWLADLDLAAGHDAAALHAYDSVLTVLPAASPERSFVLLEVISALTNLDQDDSVIARRLPHTIPYLAQMEAVPKTGYATLHDSVAVPDREFRALRQVLVAASRTRQIPLLLATTRRFFHVVAHWHGDERGWQTMEYPYTDVYLALVDQPDGRARIDSIRAELYAAGRLTPTERATLMPVSRRATADAQWRRQIDNMQIEANALGTMAPPLTAHAWLNTADSLYASTPRKRSLADGQIHVLMFGDWFPRMLGQVRGLTRRLAQRFPEGVVTTLLSNTTGAIGPDLVSPAEEVTWDRTLYETIGQIHNPIGMWAGEKRPAKYGGSLPEQSPLYEPYLYPVGAFETVIVDGKGVLRARIRPLQDDEAAKSRYEDRLDEIVRFLLKEAQGSAPTGPGARPVDLMPAGITRVP